MHPLGKVMVGDKKSELLDISPFTSKGNRVTPPWLASQGKAGQITGKCGLGNSLNIYVKPPS